MAPPVGLDAYDILGIALDATPEEVKKAYKKMSLLNHPDKAVSLGLSGNDLTEKFNEIKEAHMILSDAERRKAYDTFGMDLGEEKLDMAVWDLGMTILWNPFASCFLRTVVSRVALWLVGFKLIFGLVILLGLVYAGLFAANFSYDGHSMRDPDLVMIHLCALATVVVAVLRWLWYPLADTVVILYFAYEVVGPEGLLAMDWRLRAGVGLGSLFCAWLLEGRWHWIIGIEVLLGVIMLVAIAIAASVMKLWLDVMHDKNAEKVKKWRSEMRTDRGRLDVEIAALRKQAQG